MVEWRTAIAGGVYPVAFAARLTGSTNQKVASWFRARGKSGLPAAIETDLPRVNGQIMMPFLALVETRFVAHFRKHGLSLQTIRKAARKLRRDDLAHPFATKRFRTDGKRIMMEIAEEEEKRLLDILTDEWAFPNVVEPSLFESVVYSGDLAAQLRPMHDEFNEIIIDPRYSLGKPVVDGDFVPTETLAEAFLAEGDIDAVADWYHTTPDRVTQAVGFQQRLAA